MAAAAKPAKQICRCKELEAVLRVVLDEPMIKQSSKRPFVDRIAQKTGLTQDVVWKITGFEDPKKP